MFNPFSRAPRGGAAWFNAGPVSSFPSIDASNNGPLAQQRQCNDKFAPGCKVFHVPSEDASTARQVGIDEWKEEGAGGAKQQVMVFRYEGGFVAVDHVRKSVLVFFVSFALDLFLRLCHSFVVVFETRVLWRTTPPPSAGPVASHVRLGGFCIRPFLVLTPCEGMPPLLFPAQQRHTLRHRGLWGQVERGDYLSET